MSKALPSYYIKFWIMKGILPVLFFSFLFRFCFVLLVCFLFLFSFLLFCFVLFCFVFFVIQNKTDDLIIRFDIMSNLRAYGSWDMHLYQQTSRKGLNCWYTWANLIYLYHCTLFNDLSLHHRICGGIFKPRALPVRTHIAGQSFALTICFALQWRQRSPRLYS